MTVPVPAGGPLAQYIRTVLNVWNRERTLLVLYVVYSIVDRTVRYFTAYSKNTIFKVTGQENEDRTRKIYTVVNMNDGYS
jgi:hypothetical protein